MTIYRVQDKDGRGPWKPGFSHRWVEDRDDHDNLMPSSMQFGDVVRRVGIAGMHFGCGCLDLAQLRRWFTESEYQILKGFGYQAVQMQAGRILAQSDVQCVFERSKPLRKGVQLVELYGIVESFSGVMKAFMAARAPDLCSSPTNQPLWLWK